MQTNKALATALRLDSNRLEIARLRAQRDALADALRNIEEWAVVCFPEYATDDLPVIASARAALATLNREGAAE